MFFVCSITFVAKSRFVKRARVVHADGMSVYLTLFDIMMWHIERSTRNINRLLIVFIYFVFPPKMRDILFHFRHPVSLTPFLFVFSFVFIAIWIFENHEPFHFFFFHVHTFVHHNNRIDSTRSDDFVILVSIKYPSNALFIEHHSTNKSVFNLFSFILHIVR